MKLTLGEFRALTQHVPDETELHYVANHPTEDGVVQSVTVNVDGVTFFLVDWEEVYGEDEY